MGRLPATFLGLIALLFILLALALGQFAATADDWSNASSTTNTPWSDGANWVGGIPPTGSASTILNFGAGAGTYGCSNNIAAGFNVNQVNITNGTVTLVGLGLSMRGTAPKVSNTSGNPAVINVANIDLAVNTEINAAYDISSSANITNTGGLVKTGVGKLALTYGSGNLFTGGFIIKEGTVSGDKSYRPFGSGSSAITLGDSVAGADVMLECNQSAGNALPNAITVASGNGTRTIRGNPSSAANPVTIGGTITLTNNVIINGMGNASLKCTNNITGTGSVTLKADAAITVVLSGTVNPTGSITNNGSGSGDAIITGNIGANLTEVVQNSATSALRLGGANAAYAGTTRVLAGTLSVSNACLPDTKSVYIAAAAFLDLPHGIMDAVDKLYTNGVSLSNGLYNAGNCPSITGTGSILVTGGGGVVPLLQWAVGDGNWDFGAQQNWTNLNDLILTNYVPGSDVRFNDNNTGGSSITVTLNTNVIPASFVVSNFSKDYTIAGTGAVGGNTGLSKFGTGKLTLSGNHTFAGTTTISAGTLQIGAGGTSGTVASNIVNNGTLIFFRSDTGGTMNVPNDISGSGVLRFQGTGTQNEGKFTLGSGSTSFGGPVYIENARVTPASGNLFNGGTTIYATNTACLFFNNNNVTNANNVEIAGQGFPEGAIYYGAIRFGNKTGMINSGNIALKGDARINGPSANFIAEISGVISGNYNLLFTPVGTLVLSGANNYSGNTTVSGGTLQINQPYLNSASTVSISNAVLNLNFVATNVVAGLLTNGVALAPGVYDSLNLSGFITNTGSLQVSSGGAPGQTNITYSVSGSTLALSWPAGQGWRLEYQTNMLNMGLSTNWLPTTGTPDGSTNITIDSTKPTVFFRLVWP